MQKPCLYIVAVPIGNDLDFTLRGIDTVKNADIIIGEECSTTERMLKRLNIPGKEIIVLNEHNEESDALSIVKNIMEKSLSVALVSEAGTPCIADPGAMLVNLCYENGLKVVPIPGVSSIMATLMVSGLVKGSFKYIGFLSANKETRLRELKKIKNETIPIVLLDTPYRMKPLLNDIVLVLGSEKKMIFAYKLTQIEEMIIKSTAGDVKSKCNDLPKGEFVIVLN